MRCASCPHVPWSWGFPPSLGPNAGPQPRQQPERRMSGGCWRRLQANVRPRTARDAAQGFWLLRSQGARPRCAPRPPARLCEADLPPKLRKGRVYESVPVFPYPGKRPLAFMGCKDQTTDSSPCCSVRSLRLAQRELCRALYAATAVSMASSVRDVSQNIHFATR